MSTSFGASAASLARDRAHLALAAIRLFNGGAALLAPTWLARRLGAPEEGNRADLYALRLFGIRTVIVAVELARSRGRRRTRALDLGVVIHGSDTASAALGGLRSEVSPRVAAMTTGISALNTALALVARRPTSSRRLWLGR